MASAAGHPETRKAYTEAHRDEYRQHNRKAEAKRRRARVCDHASCLAIGPAALAWESFPHVCYICGTQLWEGVNLEFDHVVPLARGGIHCADNVRPACRPCNRRKHSKTLDEFFKVMG